MGQSISKECPKQECTIPTFPIAFDNIIVDKVDENGNVYKFDIDLNNIDKTKKGYMYVGIVISSDNPLTSFSFSSPVYGNSGPLSENIILMENKYKYNYKLDIKKIEIPNVDNFYTKFYIKAPIGSKLYYQFYFNLNI